MSTVFIYTLFGTMCPHNEDVNGPQFDGTLMCLIVVVILN